ncbi:MAG: 1-acyl-sn-glycerol-3-phosphate acyltransferase, partial [Opitutaceae bacterium]|nr:1-acyl-sn-glycerol-3-phosphate acyltransferase [Cytophagales bacterium]
ISLFQIFKRKRSIFWLLTIGLATFFIFGSLNLELEQNIARILPSKSGLAKTQDVFLKSAAFDKLIINVYSEDSLSEDPSLQLMEYSDQLTSRLQSDSIAKKYIKEIKHRLPDNITQKTYEIFNRNLPVFLDDEDYRKIDSSIEKKAIVSRLQGSLKMLSTPAGSAMRNYFLADPLFFTTIPLQKLSKSQAVENYGIQDGYVMSPDKKNLLIILKPNVPANDINSNAALIERIDLAIADLAKTQNANVKAEYFGGCAVAVCNAKQIQQDIYLTMCIALTLMTLLIWGYFRSWSLPFVILVPVAFGMLFAAASIWLFKTSISAISMGAGAIIIGISINYSLHFLTHYKHTGSIKKTLEDISLPLIIGNISTIGAFFSLTLIDSEVLKDFGLFSALSLLGGGIFTLILLPQLVKETDKHELQTGWLAETLEKIGNIQFEKSKILVALGIILTIFLGFFYNKVKFQSDLSSLNYMTPKLKIAEEHLSKQNSGTTKNIFVLYTGHNLQEVLQASEKGSRIVNQLEDQKLVNFHTSTEFLLPSDSLQKLRISLWKNFWTKEKINLFSTNFEEAATETGLKPEAFKDFFSFLSTEQNYLSEPDKSFLLNTFLTDLISTDKDFVSVITNLKVPKIHSGKVNHQLSIQNPDAVVLDKQYAANKLMDVVKDNFNQILAYSSILIFSILLLSYGRIELALITFIPMLISWVWILGFMALFDIEFNIVNIIISTFIFGLGDDFSIFIMEGLQSEYSAGKKNLASYKTAIFLSMLTTLIGVGVLIFAQHPALKSIAIISVLGILCVMLVGYLFIPLLFRILITQRIEKNLPPLTLFGITRSLFAFLYYLLGCVILTITGVMAFKVLRINNKKVKYYYHCILMLMARSLIYIMYMVKKQILNPGKEDFKKPGVIVANHQSFLDILSILMLYPKLIFFTNNWVWNSPFFGKMVQMADFYSVDDGIENSLELVKRKVDEGFSVVIFPEGGRSEDGSIKRFHKGAFFLAKTLQLDILPIVLHGTGAAMQKSDFLLTKAILTIKILPRIKFEETQLESYQDISKNCSKLIKQEYQLLNTPDFYYFRLVQNYIYKGPVIEWYMRIKVALEKNYTIFNDHIPTQGKIYDLGCGYGFMSHMLNWVSPARSITGIDYDKDKIEVADHVAIHRNKQVTFYSDDVSTFELENCDGIILADVLHYLSSEQQKSLLKNCHSSLNPGGVMLLRDGDSGQKKDHKKTVLTEFFSTRFLSFNKTNVEELEFLNFQSIQEFIQGLGHVSIETIEKSKNTSNTILKITKLPIPV